VELTERPEWPFNRRFYTITILPIKAPSTGPPNGLDWTPSRFTCH